MELEIVTLLRAAWIAGMLPIIIAEIPFPQLNSFKQVLLEFAKRGKMMQSSNNRFSVPQRFFSHFYVVAVVWTTILVIATWFYAYNRVSHNHSEQMYMMIWRSSFLLLLMEAQVLRRLFETVFVFNYSPSARMHIFGYLTGLFFYTAAPLSLCCTFAPEMFKFVGNWMINLIFEGKDRRMVVSNFDIWRLVNPLIRLRWYTWLGSVLFFWGWIHQRRCHAILVIYGGLVVASGGGDLTIWLLFGFVVANLAFAAAETQSWYRRKFDNYPTNRYAIIPFVF